MASEHEDPAPDIARAFSTSPEEMRDPATGLGPDEISEDGVDRTLIRWFLSITPYERLMWAQRQAEAVLRMREGVFVHLPRTTSKSPTPPATKTSPES